jgi:hypothetical protein
MKWQSLVQNHTTGNFYHNYRICMAKHGIINPESAKWEYLGLLLHASLFLVLDDGVPMRDEITYTRCVQKPLVRCILI